MQRPQHTYEIDYDGVTDPETLALVDDFAAMYRSVYQGAMIGAWLEDRIQLLIEGWLPEWCLSHAQILDAEHPDLQSRSWDIVVHKPVPPEMRLPPPSRRNHGYPLVPKDLCCAAIDTKGRYDQPREYARKRAFNTTNDATIPQLTLLAPTVEPILLILASKYPEQTVLATAKESGMSAFVLVRAHDLGISQGSAHVKWKLNGGNRYQPPLQEFRAFLTEAASRWRAS